ncbi:MAG: protoheme IX farnesyltransferase [Chloroflexi bacterium]|nr:protoheme IX farnesyltransferase [Chloroflexota bacterium]
MALDAPHAVRQSMSFRELLQLLATLFKLRVVSLLLFAAVAGLFLGARGLPSVLAFGAVLLTGLLAAGGASAINQYLERERDAQMSRTRKRPLPMARFNRPDTVLWMALAMILLGVVPTLFFNPVMAFWLAAGAVIYVIVYTIWLKPRSILNIVIGGAAGSCAVMTGGAAVGAASDPAVITLALLVFLWTPAHFWALALFYKEDYSRVDVPMLPVTTTDQHTARWILVHVLSTILAALALAFAPGMGWLYALPVAAVALWMLSGSLRLLRHPERPVAIRLFVATNVFLASVFLAAILAQVAHRLLPL